MASNLYNAFMAMACDSEYNRVKNVLFAEKAITSTKHHTSFGSCIFSGKADAYIIDKETKKIIGEASLERCVSTMGGNDFNHVISGNVTFSLRKYTGGSYKSSINVDNFNKDIGTWISGISDHTGRNPQQVREIIAVINDILDSKAIEV